MSFESIRGFNLERKGMENCNEEAKYSNENQSSPKKTNYGSEKDKFVLSENGIDRRREQLKKEIEPENLKSFQTVRSAEQRQCNIPVQQNAVLPTMSLPEPLAQLFVYNSIYVINHYAQILHEFLCKGVKLENQADSEHSVNHDDRRSTNQAAYPMNISVGGPYNLLSDNKTSSRKRTATSYRIQDITKDSENIDNNRREDGKLFPCQTCGKMFKKMGCLIRHMHGHTGHRPFSCQTCAKSFKHKHHLQEHMRLHTGEKPYQCKYCLKKFSHSGSFSQHANHPSRYCRRTKELIEIEDILKEIIEKVIPATIQVNQLTLCY